MWPTGNQYAVQHIHWFTLRDGLIIEHRANRDDVGMMVQLGLLAAAPPPFRHLRTRRGRAPPEVAHGPGLRAAVSRVLPCVRSSGLVRSDEKPLLPHTSDHRTLLSHAPHGRRRLIDGSYDRTAVADCPRAAGTMFETSTRDRMTLITALLIVLTIPARSPGVGRRKAAPRSTTARSRRGPGDRVAAPTAQRTGFAATNGRSCASCHVAEDAWSFTPQRGRWRPTTRAGAVPTARP